MTSTITKTPSQSRRETAIAASGVRHDDAAGRLLTRRIKPVEQRRMGAQLPELTKRAQHDAHVGAGRPTRGPRVVMHADVHELVAAAPCAHQKLGAHEGSVGVQSLTDLPGKQLEGAVDITHRLAEEESHEAEEREVVEAAQHRVVAPDAISRYDLVRAVEHEQT